ncbi:MAG: DNA gyrase subunit A [Candidatus Shikimatogenerans bostrichidophilus]|nr:MAG: DNA gyrase subunit A [Candidatus Shikimatogenerans bostrichidophilus]
MIIKYNNININNEIKLSYIDYAMSVIIYRALPDVRDGLKPVHRRILYAMYKLKLNNNKKYKKSARIVGEVLGKYHPHGDKSVYDSIIRMAQYWNLRYKLIDGQGNFGSIDNDPPAAMRYTEIRLEKITEEMLLDIDKNTVDMKLNFDDSLKEPLILPTKIPNLLINGVYGIAVGMATNMPPHNINDTINSICKYIDNPNIKINNLIKYIKAPDFPTGGIIYHYKGVKKAFKKGKGKIIIRSKFYIKKNKNKKYIIIKEIPYQVIKGELIKKIIYLIKENKINDILNIKDESNKKNIRILLILKNNSIPEKVINKLLKFTDLQISYYINNIVLVNGKPKRLGLKKLIYFFLKHRNNILIKKAKYFLLTFKKKRHLLKGFLKISNKINELLFFFNKFYSYKESFNYIKKKFKLSKKQTKFILNIKLYKLTNKEVSNYHKKNKELKKKIKYNKIIINSKKIRMKLIKKELKEIKKKYGDKRRTLIDYNNNKKNFILYKYKKKKKKYLLTISNNGYIKKTLLKKYKIQKRGGKGNIGMKINKKDFIINIIMVNNNNYILFLTKKGKIFFLKILDIPQGDKKFKGIIIQNLIKKTKNDKIKSYLLIKNLKDKKYINNHYVIIITKKGIIKKTILKKYSKIRKKGINAIKIKKNDSLLEAKLTNGNNQILLATNNGKSIRFHENKIKLTNRNSIGVKTIKIKNKNDKVIGMVNIKNYKKKNIYILVISKKGYGKCSKLDNYKITNRRCIGIKTINITKKTGKLIYIKKVKKNDDLIIIKKSGLNIRIPISSIRITSRNSQGVKLININKKDKIADVEIIKKIKNEK